MTEFVLATANPDKAREIAEILAGDISLTLRPAGVPEVEETGETLLENARLKAQAILQATRKPAVADDTGLEVDALGGEPGVRSSRYAGDGASYEDNVTKLLGELAALSDPRLACFRTVAVALYPDGRELVAEGVVPGRIATERRGTGGFGYDSVFVPLEGDGRTFAEMAPEEKNRISHRGAAFRSLLDLLMTA